MWLVREKEREEDLRKYNEVNNIKENDEPQIYEYSKLDILSKYIIYVINFI